MSYPNSDDENNISQEKNSELKAQKEMMLKQILSPDARLRLNNIRMVKPDLAGLVENYLLNLSGQGKITGQISDDQLKQIFDWAEGNLSSEEQQQINIGLASPSYEVTLRGLASMYDQRSATAG
jgi:programmed cell death protein 5